MSSMYVFTRKWPRKSNLSCFTDCTKHASAGALIHREQSIYRIFTQTKLSSIYRRKLYCHLLDLNKTSSVAYDSGEFRTCSYYFFLLFGRDRLVKSSQACGKRRETLKSWNAATSKYIQLASFLLCFGKAVNLQQTWNLEWSNVEPL